MVLRYEIARQNPLDGASAHSELFSPPEAPPHGASQGPAQQQIYEGPDPSMPRTTSTWPVRLARLVLTVRFFNRRYRRFPFDQHPKAKWGQPSEGSSFLNTLSPPYPPLSPRVFRQALPVYDQIRYRAGLLRWPFGADSGCELKM